MIILRKPAQYGGGASVAVAQTLSGNLDGANKVFQTPHEYEPSRISVMYNGQSLHSPEDFEETGLDQITLNYIVPFDDDILRATYEYLGGSAGTSDHGELDGLSGDDHTQYLTAARGNDRYYTKAQIDALIGDQRYGQFDLSYGDDNAIVTVDPPFSTVDYSVSISIENDSDTPASIYSYNIIFKSVSQFEVEFSGEIDSDNYVLSWIAIA